MIYGFASKSRLVSAYFLRGKVRASILQKECHSPLGTNISLPRHVWLFFPKVGYVAMLASWRVSSRKIQTHWRTHFFFVFLVHVMKIYQNHKFSQRWQLMENGGCRCFVSGKILAKDENGEFSGNWRGWQWKNHNFAIGSTSAHGPFLGSPCWFTGM